MALLEEMCHWLQKPISGLFLLALPVTCRLYVNSQLLPQHHDCLPAAMLPSMIVMDLLSETVNKLPSIL